MADNKDNEYFAKVKGGKVLCLACAKKERQAS